MTDESPTPVVSVPKKRRPFQFGLRSWIFFITAVSVVLGIAGRCYDRVQRQSAAIGYLQSHGFAVTHHMPSGLTRLLGGEIADRWPLWQRCLWLDIETVAQLPIYSKRPRTLDDEFWQRMAELPAVETLTIQSALNDDFRLNAMPCHSKLRSLRLNAPVNDDAVEQIAACDALTELSLTVAWNDADALEKLGRLKNLETVSFSHGSPKAVEAWCQWTTLQELRVNSAVDTPGETWARLIANNPQLISVTLHGTRETYKICDALKGSMELDMLDLSRSDVGDGGIGVLATLPKLKHIVLDATRVSGIGFEPFDKNDWPALRDLHLPRSRLDQPGLAAIVKLRQLGFLDASGNNLDDACFVDVPERWRLTNINISSTQVTDATIERLAADGLRNIEARRTQASPETAARLQNEPKTHRRIEVTE